MEKAPDTFLFPRSGVIRLMPPLSYRFDASPDNDYRPIGYVARWIREGSQRCKLYTKSQSHTLERFGTWVDLPVSLT